MNTTLRPAALPLVAALLALPLALACGDKDGDTGGTTIIPSVAANYQVTIGGITGCEGEVSWVNGWAAGPLRIEQVEGSQDLKLDFGEGYIFDGTIDGTGAYLFGGTIDYSGATLVVENTGRFITDPDFDGIRWLMDGDFEIEVDDDEFEENNCTFTSPMQAVELVDL